MRLIIIVLLILTYSSLTAQDKYVLAEPTQEEISSYSVLGDVIAKKILVSLKSELVKGMKEGGAVNALKICNIKAIPLTDDLVNSHNKVEGIKRISRKYRNPGNKPDEIDLLALNDLEKSKDQTADKLVQKYFADGKAYFNYYQSIRVGSFCTTCHGKESNMDKKLVETIRKLYPEDKATGYKAGDFRGAIKVTFTE